MSAAAEPVPPAVTVPRFHSKPLLPVSGVCSLVDRDADDVLALMESGEIAWWFDFRLAQKRGTKRHLRVLPAAVADFLKRRKCELDFDDVWSLLRPDGPTIRAKELAHILNVSVDHVYHLIERRQIIACPSRRKGPGGSGRVAATSFSKFLQKRRVL